MDENNYMLRVVVDTQEVQWIQISCNETSSCAKLTNLPISMEKRIIEISTPYSIHTLRGGNGFVISFHSSSTQNPQQRIFRTSEQISQFPVCCFNTQKRIVKFESEKYWVADCELLFNGSLRNLKKEEPKRIFNRIFERIFGRFTSFRFPTVSIEHARQYLPKRKLIMV